MQTTQIKDLNIKAVIMAGGKGTRVQEIAPDIPKPMIKILGKPILQYQIECLRNNGITDITLIVGYKKEFIQNYFQHGENFGVNINYIIEEEPLGTAGALYYLKEYDEDFIFLFGDLIFDIDFQRFFDFHKSHHGLITLYCHPNSHPYDSDVIVSDDSNKVIQILNKKEERNFYYSNLVNSGVSIVNTKALENLYQPIKSNFETNIIKPLLNNGLVYSYKYSEYIKDAGTPDRLKAVENDIQNGSVFAKNLSKKQKAIFLDRDGTINKSVGFLTNINQFEVLNKVTEAIKLINSSQYLTIVTTNQPVIARGEVTYEELNQIHQKMETLLGNEGAYLDDIYYCPHHPDSGFADEIKELKIDCDCRKPNIGLLLQASEKYNIDLLSSWYIGDRTVDIQTGKNANMKTILLLTGEAGKDKKYNVAPDYIANNLLEAIEYIFKEEHQ